jgi:hypothetical protein
VDSDDEPKDAKRTRFDVLQVRIRGLVEDATGRRKDVDFEAELDCDDGLHYRHVIAAIAAISGYKAKRGDSEVVKLIDKIKFASPDRAQQKIRLAFAVVTVARIAQPVSSTSRALQHLLCVTRECKDSRWSPVTSFGRRW